MKDPDMTPHNCPVCGYALASDAERCPGCDSPVPRRGDAEAADAEPPGATPATHQGLRPGDVAILRAQEHGRLPTWVWFAGVFIALAIVITAGILALFGVFGGASDEEGGTAAIDDAETPAVIVTLPPVRQGDLTVGTCIDWDEYEKAVDGEPFTRLSCSDPHDAEIYLLYDFPDGPYPGEDAVTDEMTRRCDDEFWAYVGEGYDGSVPLSTSTWWPTDTGWESGYRTGTCLLAADDGKLTGSWYWADGAATIRTAPRDDA